MTADFHDAGVAGVVYFLKNNAIETNQVSPEKCAALCQSRSTEVLTPGGGITNQGEGPS